MGFNKQRLMEKVEQLNNPKGFSSFSSHIWKPKPLDKGQLEGAKSTIRVLDYPYSEDNFLDLWFHYGVGQGPGFLCPKRTAGKDCPVCQFAYSLLKTGVESDKEAAKKLFATQRFYAVVVDMADPELTPKYWGFNKRTYLELVEYARNPDYEDFNDPKIGFDLNVWYYKTDAKKLYPNLKFQFRIKPTPIGDDAKIQEVIGNVKRIDQIFKPLTQAEIKERLASFIDLSNVQASEASSETVRGASSVASFDVDQLDEENATAETKEEEELAGTDASRIEAAFNEAYGESLSDVLDA